MLSAERVERHRGKAGRSEQVAAYVVVSFENVTVGSTHAVECEARADVDRALRPNALDGKSVALQRCETIVHGVEAGRRIPAHALDEGVDARMVREEPRRCDLLGSRRPGTNVADDVTHRLDHIGGTDGPTHAKASGGEGLRDRIDHDDIRRDRW